MFSPAIKGIRFNSLFSATPYGVGVTICHFARWCRCAQPPATSCQSYGVAIRMTLRNVQRFLYLLVTYLVYIHVGKGLPTYCVTRVVGRQPLAAKDKQSNQSTLKTLYHAKAQSRNVRAKY